VDNSQLQTLAIIRAAVGYLGERDQFAWWQSSFFAPGSRAFVAPVFSRTQVLAQCAGVTRAAALAHDERIGVGSVYHLFRLPENIEQSIHRALQDARLGNRINSVVTTRDAALNFLQTEAATIEQVDVGPTRIGSTRDIRKSKLWRTVIAQYVLAFGQGTQAYPYFAD
jgi:hypothetical protein